MEPGGMSWVKIQLRRNGYVSRDGVKREVDQIELWGFDLTLRQTIMSDRDVMLAGKAAEDLGIPFFDDRSDHCKGVWSRADNAAYRFEATSELHESWEACARDMYYQLTGINTHKNS